MGSECHESLTSRCENDRVAFLSHQSALEASQNQVEGFNDVAGLGGIGCSQSVLTEPQELTDLCVHLDFDNSCEGITVMVPFHR